MAKQPKTVTKTEEVQPTNTPEAQKQDAQYNGAIGAEKKEETPNEFSWVQEDWKKILLQAKRLGSFKKALRTAYPSLTDEELVKKAKEVLTEIGSTTKKELTTANIIASSKADDTDDEPTEPRRNTPAIPLESSEPTFAQFLAVKAELNGKDTAKLMEAIELVAKLTEKTGNSLPKLLKCLEALK